MAVTIGEIEHFCSLEADTGTVAIQWTADGMPHVFEITLKQAAITIYSHTGTLLSSYAFSGVVAGSYDIQIYSVDTGASDVVTYTFDCSPTTFYVNHTESNPTTVGGSDGTIDLTAFGGYEPYTFLWDDGPTTEDRTGLPAGTYHVVATSADAQTAELTIILVDPATCDLTITALTVNKESLRRAGDATITVSTTTSNVGPIEYSLDNTTWQSSNVLTNLDEGDYTVYVRQYACTDEGEVTISRRDPKYYIQYEDAVGNVTRAELLEVNFTGTAERLIGGGDPVVFKWQGEGEERFELIKGSECTVSFQSDVDFKFIDIFTADTRKYRIDIYKAPRGNDLQLYWTGYVLPEIYSEPYISAPYFVQMKAVDGLGMLKYVPFDLEGAAISQFSIVRHIIDKLDLYIPLKIADDLYETAMLLSVDDEPMLQSLVNTSVYVKNNKKMKCLDVLTSNLILKYARIYQDRGAIRITRYDQIRGIYAHRVYDKRGNFLFSQFINPVKVIQTPPGRDQPEEEYPFFINGDAVLNIQTAYHTISATLEFGGEGNLITDGDFLPSAFSAPDQLINWTDTAHIEARNPYPGKYAVAITDDGTTPGFKITSRPVYLYFYEVGADVNSISFEFTYYVKASVLGLTTPKVPYQIKIGTKYWTGSAWTSTPTIIEETAQVNVTSRTFIAKIPIPEDGELTVSFYAVIPNDFTVEEVQYSNVIAKFLPFGLTPPTSESYEVSQSIPYTFEPDEIVAVHGDTPSPAYPSSIQINQPGSPTIIQSTEWCRATMAEGKKLLQILVESIAAGYAVPTAKITGTIKGGYAFGNSLKHNYFNNRIFVINGATFHDKSAQWQGEWMEALEVQPAADPGAHLLETGEYVILENGELSLTEEEIGELEDD